MVNRRWADGKLAWGAEGVAVPPANAGFRWFGWFFAWFTPPPYRSWDGDYWVVRMSLFGHELLSIFLWDLEVLI
jgi:hypothetical protein